MDDIFPVVETRTVPLNPGLAKAEMKEGYIETWKEMEMVGVVVTSGVGKCSVGVCNGCHPPEDCEGNR